MSNSSAGESTLAQVHPSFFWKAPVSFAIWTLFVLILVPLAFVMHRGAGAILTFLVLTNVTAAWLRCVATTLTITTRRTILRHGILSKHTSEVSHTAIRQVILRQSFAQRLFSVGYLGLSSSAGSDVEIEIDGIRHPETLKSLIDAHR